MFRGKSGKKICTLCVLFLLIIVLADFAAAEDIAYIYKRDYKIDENVLNVFDSMGYTVKLINEKIMPSNFSNYKMIFIGDEKLSKADKVPIEKVPSVIMSRYSGNLYGLTDRDGVSKLVSSAPLEVVQGNKKITVYETAFKTRRVSVPYYFLSKENRLDSLLSIAMTKKSSGNKRGDVVSYVSSGTTLLNEKTTVGNICFFGIAASDYWTKDAEKMFKDCVSFTIAGSQSPGSCNEDVDCGTNGFVGENICSGGNVVKKYKMFDCNSGACSSTEENRVVQTCIGGCSAGSCVQQSEATHNLALVNVTNSVGQIRVQTMDGEDVLFDESLECNEKYKVAVKVKNLGNYTENATFEGSVGSLEITHGEIEDLEPGKTSDRSKTINFSLAEGNYNISIELNVEGFLDSNPLDNLVKRNIRVSCGATSTCSQNNDCGTDGFVGNTFCINNDVGKKYKIFSCNSGACSFSEENRVFQTCSNSCLNGACVQSSGLIHDIALVNVTNTVGLIRLQTSEGVDVPVGTSIQCNKKYKIIVKPKNLGNYTENITFEGSVGSLNVDYSSVILDAGETGSTKTKTLNFTLAAGTYDLNVAAILNGFADSNPSNNVANKQIVVSC